MTYLLTDMLILSAMIFSIGIIILECGTRSPDSQLLIVSLSTPIKLASELMSLPSQAKYSISCLIKASSFFKTTPQSEESYLIDLR